MGVGEWGREGNIYPQREREGKRGKREDTFERID